MSSYEIISLFIGIVGALFALLAWLNSRRSVNVAERSFELAEQSQNTARESLGIAREQVSIRPALDIQMWTKYIESVPANGSLNIEVTNSGKVTANNIRGWLKLPADTFEHWKEEPPEPRESNASFDFWKYSTAFQVDTPPRSWGQIFREDQKPQDGWYEAQIYEKHKLLPDSVRAFNFSVHILRTGATTVYCKIVCDEGPMFEGYTQVGIPDQGLSEDNFFGFKNE